MNGSNKYVSRLLELWLMSTLLFVTYLIPTKIAAQNVKLKTQSEVNSFDTSITDIVGYLEIGSENSDIINLSNLSNVKSVSGNLIIKDNSLLTTLQGLQSITTIGLSLQIINNEKLEHIDELIGIETIGNDVKINKNGSLSNINGLESISIIEGDFDLSDNDNLESLEGMDNIVEIGGYLRCISNDKLKDLKGLGSLREVCDYLRIADNDMLLSLDGIVYLFEVGGFLSIRDNIALKNIDNLINLRRVGGYVNIYTNAELENIDGLHSLISIEEYLRIQFNNKLKDCCSIKKFAENPQLANDEVLINNNWNGCNSVWEIIELECDLDFALIVQPSCLGLDNGSISVKVIGVYQPPIYYEWDQLDGSISGSDISNEDYFNIEMLPPGIYSITVYTDSQDPITRSNIIIEYSEGAIFEITEIQTYNASNGFSTGGIDIKWTGGEAPYVVTWSGPSNGAITNIMDKSQFIDNLLAGEYSISLTDIMGNTRDLYIELLDDTVLEFECNEPIDIVILNDVSSSVDATEYNQSQQFFVGLTKEINIGLESNSSQVAIIEWANNAVQNIIVPLTGDTTLINSYIGSARSGQGGTGPVNALRFGKEYLEENARDTVPKVIILATDASKGQVSNSLVFLAKKYKSLGYIIITIAFDEAYNDMDVRELLSKAASINALSPGATTYSDLNQEIAKYIVNLYLCPFGLGDETIVFFQRDGSIAVDEIHPLGNCPFPVFVEITFTVTASNQLSIPPSTPVSFYLNDPLLPSASYISSWNIPCAIAVGESETFSITLPISEPSLVYAVLNDDGSTQLPIQFPITTISESDFSNNIDVARICVDETATIQAIKYCDTPIPACDTIVNYTTTICNISEVDAFDVVVEDEPPTSFQLIYFNINDNECSTIENGTYDIPVGCCVTINYSYDASNASQDQYTDQDVLLSGPDNQTYLGYEGMFSDGEDVIIDGSIDCPSTIVEFFKEVNLDESCDDGFVSYTFTIVNEMNIPLQGLTFQDVLPLPCEWVFQPYEKSGISIANVELSGSTAEFIISEIDAETTATFTIDAILGTWSNNAALDNQATLSGIAGAFDGGITTLSSNTVSTDVFASPTIEILDTITIGLNSDTISLSAIVTDNADVQWTSNGDGVFLDSIGNVASYVLGILDKSNQSVNLFISAETDCHQTGQPLVILIDQCMIEIDPIVIGECNDNGTPFSSDDDYYILTFNTTLINSNGNDTYLLVVNGDTLSSNIYGEELTISLSANGIPDIIELVDHEKIYCNISLIVNQNNCSNKCEFEVEYFDILSCNYNDIPNVNYDFLFNIAAINVSEEDTYYLILDNDTLGIYSYNIDQSITLENTGLEELVFTIASTSDCADPINIPVEIFAIDIELQLPDYLCADSETTIELIATPNNNLSYLWGPSECISAGATTHQPTISASNTDKEITLQVSNNSTGCTMDFQYYIPVVDFDIYINADPDTIVTLGDLVDISVSDSQIGDSYLWDNAVTDISQIVSPESATTYSVTVTDINGCTDIDQITINVIPPDCDIYIPNAFTPNGDGTNDLLYIRSANSIELMEFYIYNRWGEKIFSTNDQNIPWDGKYKNELLAPDAFAYYLNVTCTNGIQHEQKGSVSILR